MIEYIFMVVTVLGAIITHMQRDLLKAAILTGIPGVGLALLYEYLQAPDVALERCGLSHSTGVLCTGSLRTRRVEE